MRRIISPGTIAGIVKRIKKPRKSQKLRWNHSLRRPRGVSRSRFWLVPPGTTSKGKEVLNPSVGSKTPQRTLSLRTRGTSAYASEGRKMPQDPKEQQSWVRPQARFPSVGDGQPSTGTTHWEAQLRSVLPVSNLGVVPTPRMSIYELKSQGHQERTQ